MWRHGARGGLSGLVLPRVFGMILESESPDKIAEFLGSIASKSMGLGVSRERDMAIAELMLSIKRGLGL